MNVTMNWLQNQMDLLWVKLWSSLDPKLQQVCMLHIIPMWSYIYIKLGHFWNYFGYFIHDKTNDYRWDLNILQNELPKTSHLTESFAWQKYSPARFPYIRTGIMLFRTMLWEIYWVKTVPKFRKVHKFLIVKTFSLPIFL